MTPLDVIIAAPHAPRSQGGAIGSTLVALLLVAWLAHYLHMRSRTVLFTVTVMVAGAMVVSMGGQAGSAMRSLVNFADSAPGYIASLFS